MSDEIEEQSDGLSADPKLSEIFDYLDTPEGGAQVVPVTVQDDPHDCRLMIVIRGERIMASTIMAALAEKIGELSDISQQREAAQKAQDERPRIVTR